MTEPQGLSDAARDIMMRGGVPGNATQWVARVAKGLEAHYRTLQREDGVRIAKLESRLVRQERELAEARANTKAEMDARLGAEAEARRTAEALAANRELTKGLEASNDSLRRVKSGHDRDRGQVVSLLQKAEAERDAMAARLGEAEEALRGWMARAEALQQGANEAARVLDGERASKIALQRCLVRERDYPFGAEAGFQMHTVVQLAPTRPTVTVLGGAAPFAAGETQTGVDDGALAALAKAWP